MTSPSSNPSSTVKPLSAEERAAWAAQNRFEDEDRRERFGRMSFAEKLSALEAQGRLMSLFAQRRAAQRPG